MPRSPSDLARVLVRLTEDEDFYADCKREIRAKQGDVAVLALVSFASRHGYKITFRQADRAGRYARTLAGVEDRLDAMTSHDPGAGQSALHKALAEVRGTDMTVQRFFRQW